MGSKKRRNHRAGDAAARPAPARRRFWPGLLVVALVALAILVWRGRQPQETADDGPVIRRQFAIEIDGDARPAGQGAELWVYRLDDPGGADAMPARVPDASELPPLPLVPFPTPRPLDVVRAAYEFAALHPEVMRYVPCYCGCERSGHGDNEDCFVRSRDANGNVTWDAHGMG